MDFDWGHHHVIYHGWNRPGWVNHARPYVHVRNVYINRSRPYINQTWRHDSSHGSPDSYRASHPGRGHSVGRPAHIPEVRGKAAIPAKPPPKPPAGMFGPRGDTHSFSNRGRQSRGIVSAPPRATPQDPGKRPATPAPSVSQRPATPPPGISPRPVPPAPSISKGPPQVRPARESVQPPKTPSVTFGGYRGANEARGQSLRGQASRQSGTVAHPPSDPAPKASIPERKDGARGGAPAGKDDTRGKSRR